MARVARKQRKSGSKTILLTGRPYKKLLEKKKQKKGKAPLKRKYPKVQCKRSTKKFKKERKKKGKVKKRANTDTTDSEEDDPPFIVCCELISKSRSRKKWIS